MADPVTKELHELSVASKKAFQAGEFDTAHRLLQQMNESNPHFRYVQLGDGTVHYVTKDEDGKEVSDKRTGELVTKAVE